MAGRGQGRGIDDRQRAFYLDLRCVIFIPESIESFARERTQMEKSQILFKEYDTLRDSEISLTSNFFQLITVAVALAGIVVSWMHDDLPGMAIGLSVILVLTTASAAVMWFCIYAKGLPKPSGLLP
jgi:hypothetical protein